MMSLRPAVFSRALVTTAAALALLGLRSAAPGTPDLSGLVWRNIGPFRGGRIAAVSGAVGQPGTFYVGLPAGGVWKTTSAGETWFPVFDDIKEVSSVGAVEVAPGNANIIYAGTGDQVTGGAINEGNGVYKSSDAGRTWKHIGLDSTKQIPSIVVDPRNADVVLVAAQGDIHVKNGMRGVFRSADGGATWQRTLFVNDSTGIQKLAIAFDKPDVVFATTVRHYTPAPAVSGAAAPPPAVPNTNASTGTSLYKSVDGGVTWTEITGGGLPRLNGRTSVAIANTTTAQRVLIITNTGLYRSDDGGTTWRQMDPTDTRIRNGQGGYNCGVYFDPKNPDVIYTINTASYKSTDGGNTFTGFKGAPGGDDPQQMWIDPTNGQRMLFGYDQGAIVSLDGGGAWSSWYNQSTEQVYHITTDNAFPYFVYASQQDAGAIRTRSRGDLGAITPLDWSPVPGWEWGSLVVDPLDDNVVYASGSGLRKIRYPSEQWSDVSPAVNTALRLRSNNTAPLTFTPWNQHRLLAGFQYLMATIDGGAHWTKLSPNLGYAKGVTVPPDSATPVPGALAGGAIESIAPSTVARGMIWVGTDNGLIKLTRNDGVTWEDVSIPNLPFAPRAVMSSLEASHFNAGTAYAAVDIHRTGEYAPHFFRTRDFGKSWTEIDHGLRTNEPSGSFSRVLREDPKKARLLVAGTESGMYVSFDDGDAWQSLQLNLPNTSYRDATIHGNDLVVGTYGRGVWVLDDFAVLRQMTPTIAGEAVHLFKPAASVRVRRNVGDNTPFPPEVPHALNAPDGVLVFYALASKPSGEVTLDVLDSTGVLVRHLSSIAVAPVAEAARPPHPNFWVREPVALPANAGLNRTNWDLRYDAPPAFTHSFEINANPGLTPTAPEGPLALPGLYTFKLTVDGHAYTQSARVTNDPRSSASLADLRAQHMLLEKLLGGVRAAWDVSQQATALRTTLTSAAVDSTSDAGKAIALLLAKVGGFAPTDGGRGGARGGATTTPTFATVQTRFLGQLDSQDKGDMAPTAAALANFSNGCHDLTIVTAAWRAIMTKDVPAVNALLASHGRQALPVVKALPVPNC
jgi:hypothetical protein